MAETAPQRFENHTRIVPMFIAVLLIFFVNFIYALIRLVRAPAAGTAVGVLMATAFILLAFNARRFATTVQDRVIRLEMRLRMRALLPADLQSQINDFTLRQLVALRFAGDDELPALCRTVLTDKVADGKSIKKMIKNWQPDHLRA